MTDYGESAPMISDANYRRRLFHWAIVQHLPNLQRKILGRFYKRSDADGRLQALQRLTPGGEFEVLFDLEE